MSALPEPARTEDLLRRAAARLRAEVMAVVFALTGGTGLLVATAWLLVRGGDPMGPHLGLLDNYFPGYSVTWPGAVIGFLYGALTGAMIGGSVAWLYNRLADLRERRGGSSSS